MEATIGLNLASAFWGPFKDFVFRLPDYFEKAFLDWQSKMESRRAAGEIGSDVAKCIADDCQKIVDGFRKSNEILWKFIKVLLWGAAASGVYTLYIGLEGWFTLLFLAPVPFFLLVEVFVCCITGCRMSKKLGEGNVAVKLLDEASERKKRDDIRSKAERKSKEEFGDESDS